MLYTLNIYLNIYNFTCQFYLNKAGMGGRNDQHHSILHCQILCCYRFGYYVLFIPNFNSPFCSNSALKGMQYIFTWLLMDT